MYLVIATHTFSKKTFSFNAIWLNLHSTHPKVYLEGHCPPPRFWREIVQVALPGARKTLTHNKLHEKSDSKHLSKQRVLLIRTNVLRHFRDTEGPANTWSYKMVNSAYTHAHINFTFTIVSKVNKLHRYSPKMRSHAKEKFQTYE